MEQPTGPARRAVDVVIGIIVRDSLVLICQRPSNTTFPGHWEFPGGKREASETIPQCLARELHEELAVAVRPLTTLDPIEHDYPTARIRLHPYVCALAGGEPRPLACQQLRWVDPPALREYQFPPANEPLIERVIDALDAVHLLKAPSPCGGTEGLAEAARGRRPTPAPKV